jgi:hypothetical protein
MAGWATKNLYCNGHEKDRWVVRWKRLGIVGTPPKKTAEKLKRATFGSH